MSSHTAEILWERHDGRFTDNRYSRVHRWGFDGGAVVAASSSPHVVRVPFSDPSCVDPEEAFVASLSSCHMLWFLGFAARDGYLVDRYADAAVGEMAKNAEGREAVTRVTLRPAVTFSGTLVPDDDALERLHHEAHESCFLANSVKTVIEIAGSWSHQ
ncbi:peroxiredoxin [Duganella sp. Leaf61]|uniref:OsmC family protein n=1 Tax=Duganella sp. Leaf61 TaxID=1736227 RepID=UPI0006FD9678|nr:OsmC family protein [Duganella sp. Leaf61]KQN69442.1 peroxiredoxin [Duganella sp. Leaf61]